LTDETRLSISLRGDVSEFLVPLSRTQWVREHSGHAPWRARLYSKQKSLGVESSSCLCICYRIGMLSAIVEVKYFQ